MSSLEYRVMKLFGILLFFPAFFTFWCPYSLCSFSTFRKYFSSDNILSLLFQQFLAQFVNCTGYDACSWGRSRFDYVLVFFPNVMDLGWHNVFKQLNAKRDTFLGDLVSFDLWLTKHRIFLQQVTVSFYGRLVANQDNITGVKTWILTFSKDICA